MRFSEALTKLQDSGIGIYRPSWNGNANRPGEGKCEYLAGIAAARAALLRAQASEQSGG